MDPFLGLVGCGVEGWSALSKSGSAFNLALSIFFVLR